MLTLAVSSHSNAPKVLRKPFCSATIDYTAANEYVEAHYGNSSPRVPYFGRSIQKEAIYDAREGPATIDSCGFTLLNEASQVKDWTKLSHIRETYLPQLRTILQETYRESKIQDIVFWNPMLRGQDLKQTRPNDDSSTPTASFAASPHIDTDIGAYDKPEELIRLFEINRVDTHTFPTHDLVEAIKNGQRFAIVNAWRNIAAFPVVSNPLALFSVRYDEPKKAFPEAAPNMNQSKWYTYSNMTQDEVLLFCQYDRDVTRSSDLWHCALPDVGDVNSPPRRSFDVRCFILFDEIVPKENDRYSDTRLASLLTQEESGCFCDEQAERRGFYQES
jgi:hypothetical protein